MRYGVISDVHANLPALEAVLAELDRVGVDAYACAGDLVGYGSQPNECVEVVRKLGAVCVAGNHDLIALGKLSEDRCERIARESLRWTREALDDCARDYLDRLPLHLDLPGGIVLAHGSLDDPQEYVLRADQATVQLGRLGESYPAARILVVGHTHRAFAHGGRTTVSRIGARESVALDGSGRWLLNPGAVGQSREPLVRARFMVLDLERGAAVFRAVRYDVGRSRALLRQEGLPARSVHLPPWRIKALLRPAIRAVRRVQAQVRGRWA
jgi:predicted phosphodiesterase